ncbi:hypothetical protein FDUTEX481_02067 [Tolypothrix sp. PCC 7601]|nr:hypothetical protein FDUTEX481_02067 [Tolypothrix sp. PCC 7601]
MQLGDGHWVLGDELGNKINSFPCFDTDYGNPHNALRWSKRPSCSHFHHG